jgi:hypothetical protein
MFEPPILKRFRGIFNISKAIQKTETRRLLHQFGTQVLDFIAIPVAAIQCRCWRAEESVSSMIVSNASSTRGRSLHRHPDHHGTQENNLLLVKLPFFGCLVQAGHQHHPPQAPMECKDHMEVV